MWQGRGPSCWWPGSGLCSADTLLRYPARSPLSPGLSHLPCLSHQVRPSPPLASGCLQLRLSLLRAHQLHRVGERPVVNLLLLFPRFPVLSHWWRGHPGLQTCPTSSPSGQFPHPSCKSLQAILLPLPHRHLYPHHPSSSSILILASSIHPAQAISAPALFSPASYGKAEGD